MRSRNARAMALSGAEESCHVVAEAKLRRCPLANTVGMKGVPWPVGRRPVPVVEDVIEVVNFFPEFRGCRSDTAKDTLGASEKADTMAEVVQALTTVAA